MLKIGFDIGGVISKYPNEFTEIIGAFHKDDHLIYVITDMHPKTKVLETLSENGFIIKRELNDHLPGLIHPDRVYSADYEKYGNMAKAVIIKELGIQIFVDAFEGYLCWDSRLGPQPILFKVQPDAFKPYWHNDWQTKDNVFGRRKFSVEDISR